MSMSFRTYNVSLKAYIGFFIITTSSQISNILLKVVGEDGTAPSSVQCQCTVLLLYYSPVCPVIKPVHGTRNYVARHKAARNDL